MSVIHGGQLHQVAKAYPHLESQWLDLSTGIAPFSYPIPNIPAHIWQDLPTVSDDLIDVAKRYYHAENCWPVAGSQSVIEKLPQLWNIKSEFKPAIKHAYLPEVGYKEHQQAWLKAGYRLHVYQSELPTEIEKGSVVIVINPNNPLTDTFTIKALKRLQVRCQQKKSLLIIDEAFADIFPPEFSFVPHIKEEKCEVMVLRSFGKFFGLAGLRIGFVCSSNAWCKLIQQSSGPWAINGPALFITKCALRDKQWQQQQIVRLQENSHKQQTLLKQFLPSARVEGNALFITVFLNNASEMYQQLCLHAIYVRLTDENDALRFGIADQQQLKRLETVLTILMPHLPYSALS